MELDDRTVAEHEAAFHAASERAWAVHETPDVAPELKARVYWIARVVEARERLALANARRADQSVRIGASASEFVRAEAEAEAEADAIELEWAQYMHDGYADVWHLDSLDPAFTARRTALIARQEDELRPRLYAARLAAARLSGDPTRIRIADLEAQAHEAHRTLGTMPIGTTLQHYRAQLDHHHKSLASQRLDHALAVTKRDAGDPRVSERWIAALAAGIEAGERLITATEGLIASTVRFQRGKR